jgi:hypothetical protein
MIKWFFNWIFWKQCDYIKSWKDKKWRNTLQEGTYCSRCMGHKGDHKEIV